MFVYVYTFQLDGLAVDEQANVWFAVFGYLIGGFDLERRKLPYKEWFRLFFLRLSEISVTDTG